VSPNIEDRRGGGGFGGGGMRIGLGGMLVLFVLSLIFGRDFFSLVGVGGGDSLSQTSQADRAAEEPVVQFVSFVLDDTQETWRSVLPQYRDTRLVLFRDAAPSGCGYAQSASGPFYCPADQKVYLDLSFFEELNRRFGAPGDFAQAYVIAHEIGHHVQNLLGIAGDVRREQQFDPRGGNATSVRLELQADCFAGIWGHSTAQRDILERGDVEEGLNAAAAIGDDRLQREAGRRVSPESFTHGTSAQRVEWFRRGLESGKVSACDTFRGM
jgi:predicted metalloprotease